MLLDQGMLDHLLYVYRVRERFIRAERIGGAETDRGSPRPSIGT
jgi:hypothetical protein